MHSQLKLVVAAAALSAFSACCSKPADTTTRPVASAGSAQLRAYYASLEGSTFRAEVSVDQGEPCTKLPADAGADVGGVSLEGHQGATCSCLGDTFGVTGAPVPAETTGTFRVADSTGEMSATVPSLFVEPTVSLRGTSVLVVGSRVYLDFLPANEDVTDVMLSFTPSSRYSPTFTRDSSDGTVGRDDAGWYLDVPPVQAEAGELTVSTYGRFTPSSCVGAATCVVTTSATRRLSTAVAIP